MPNFLPKTGPLLQHYCAAFSVVLNQFLFASLGWFLQQFICLFVYISDFFSLSCVSEGGSE
jgi:hypothetical protein